MSHLLHDDSRERVVVLRSSLDVEPVADWLEDRLDFCEELLVERFGGPLSPFADSFGAGGACDAGRHVEGDSCHPPVELDENVFCGTRGCSRGKTKQVRTLLLDGLQEFLVLQIPECLVPRTGREKREVGDQLSESHAGHLPA